MELQKLEADIKSSIKDCEKQIADLEHQLYVTKQQYLTKIVELADLKKELIHVSEHVSSGSEEHKSKAKTLLEKLRAAFDDGFQNVGI